MLSGSYTAIVTPFKNNTVDYNGLGKLVEFQIESGITGILAVGTTGESPTLSWDEHNKVIEKVSAMSANKCLSIAGTGSNNTHETIHGTRHAAETGVDAILLVGPYYNGPSSLEIRKEYIEPVASAFPDLEIIPYVIPGRTGTQLLPEDLALLFQNFKNVSTVKEATGDLENMKRTRACCGPDYVILSGDDGITYEMMTDPQIKAAGVISVVSNIAPAAVVQFVDHLEHGRMEAAQKQKAALEPLFELVTVKTLETTPHGEVVCRARNPLAVKTLMNVLGMPSGHCRPPVGKMTRKGLEKVLETARRVQADSPEVFKPLADFFGVNVEERLNTPSNWDGLCYESYA